MDAILVERGESGLDDRLVVFRADAEGVPDVPGRMSLGIEGRGSKSSV